MQKQLEKSRLNYEKLQTVLCEVETILNNRPLTYYYSDNTEQCTPNRLLFGRTIKLFDPEPIDITHGINFHSKKISNIINHFWERWRREYLNMLRENHKITSTNKNHPTISLNDIVFIEEERKPRSTWKIGIVVELIKGKDDNVQGAIVRVPKSNYLITKPICKLYHIESLREGSDEIVTVNDNTIKERPKREAAILGNIKRKFTN